MLQQQVVKLTTDSTAHLAKPLVSDVVLYGCGAVILLIVGSLVGTYRFHLRELSKIEQNEVAFLRFRAAITHASTLGFDREIRAALVLNAFSTYGEAAAIVGATRIESPVPGHLPSDAATALLNRLLAELDIVVRAKGKTVNE
jgi:hypothetical protein